MGIANLTSTVTVNAAFLQEIKEVNQELWQLLSEVRQQWSRLTASRSSQRQLVGTLEQLCDQLALHFALEEAYGYFDDPVTVAPRLSEQAERLRTQHRELYVTLCDLVEQAQQAWCSRNAAPRLAELAAEFEAFDRSLQTHEAREQQLIVQAYTDDIGECD